jgi:hypothetical protein
MAAVTSVGSDWLPFGRCAAPDQTLAGQMSKHSSLGIMATIRQSYLTGFASRTTRNLPNIGLGSPVYFLPQHSIHAGIMTYLTTCVCCPIFSFQHRRDELDPLSLKCYLVSVVKTFDPIKIGTSLDNRLIAGSSLDGNLQFCNPAFEDLAGKTMRDMVGTNRKARTHPNYYEQTETQWAITLETGISVMTDIFQSYDGSLHRVLWKNELITPGDAFILCSGTVLDYNVEDNIICFPVTPNAR